MWSIPLKAFLSLVTGGTFIFGITYIPASITSSESFEQWVTTRTKASSTNHNCLTNKAQRETSISIQTDRISGNNRESIVTRQEKSEELDRKCEDLNVLHLTS